MKIYVILPTLLASMLLVAVQCGPAPASQSGAPKITVSEPYASAVLAGGNGVIYLNLVNEGNGPDILLSVESQVAEAAELHETKIDENDIMQMSPLASIEVPAGGLVKLEPGGKHIMLINLKQGLKAGEQISLILNFEKTGPLAVEAEIRQMGAAPEHDTGHGNHGHELEHND